MWLKTYSSKKVADLNELGSLYICEISKITINE